MGANLKIICSSIVTPHNDDSWLEEIPKPMKRRAPRIWKMAQVAVERLLKNHNTIPRSVITATALGALDETVGFLKGSFSDGFGSPRNFIASVHNSMAGNIAMNFKIKGPNLTVCDSQNSLASSIVSASLMNKNDFPLLLLAVDERTELLNLLNKNFSDDCQKYLPSSWTEGAVAFLITKDNNGVTVEAEGPSPLQGLEIDKLTDSIFPIFKEKGYNPISLEESSNSFIAPAIKLYNLLNDSKEGKWVIPSYSPASKAYSLIKVDL